MVGMLLLQSVCFNVTFLNESLLEAYNLLHF
jgi:hypothetical protein